MTLSDEELLRLHEQAMAAADFGLLERLRDPDVSRSWFKKAFQLERTVAIALSQEFEEEPTRSILLRSAATLALDCCDYGEAERLVAQALSGYPPEDVRLELLEVLDQAGLARTMESVKLAQDELLVDVKGRAIGKGFAPAHLILSRLSDLSRVLARVAERLLGLPYREKGPFSRQVREVFALYVNAFSQGSIRVSLSVGKAVQLDLFEKRLGPDEVVSEFSHCVSLYQNEREDELRTHIGSEPYFRNFTGLLRKVAPDGDLVRSVNFHIGHGEGCRTVSLTRATPPFRHKELLPKAPRTEHGGGQLVIEGTLAFASSLGVRDRVRIVDDNDHKTSIVVPEGLMADIVKPLWGERVRVLGSRRRGEIYLDHIDSLE